MPHILIVEDEAAIADTLIFALQGEGFTTTWLSLGAAALEHQRATPADLIILDIGLPDISGFETCKQLRRFSEVPVMFLSARDAEIDRVVGLEIGADDYVVKPFSPREMVARVRAILRRANIAARADEPTAYDKGGLKIDFTTYEVIVRGKAAKLTLKEFELLRFLVQNPNRVLSRDQLLDRVWGGETYVTPRTVDVHIRRLRKAIEKDDSKPKWILTLRGVGYKFDEKALEQ